MYRAEVFVTLKPVVNDPAGLTIRGGLQALGFDSVKDVRAGKYLAIPLDEPDEGRARARVEEMAQQLLANELMEDFRTAVQPPWRRGSSPSPAPGVTGSGHMRRVG